jgi:crotonobetainyl-CoA:carnitine CoA-transferase CaiB-like acyl-CoA transferase
MKEKFWQRFATHLGLAHLIDDPRFRTFQDRLTHRHELIGLLKDVMRTGTTAEWVERLRGSVPCAPVYTVAEALEDEHVLAREMVVTVDHPQFGALREVGCPIKMAGVSPRYEAASRLGADTDPLLRTLLGIGDADIARLRRQGAI